MTDSDPMPEHASDQPGYTPVFPDAVRTAIYVICLAAGVAALGCMTFGQPEIGGFIATAASLIAAGFGVTYNPIRLAGK
ncbi:hypothetical protein [Bifidobacterium favimelis]|uniref:DoxX n=1 Tax=Bifidobacterium favimelis TaxID=3122979 RepID=A0ABU8ZMD4_9BIFI